MQEVRIGVPVYCARCERRKAPVGRSVPVGMDLCDRQCPGYELDPKPGELWPRESNRTFGYPVRLEGTVAA